MGKVRLRLNLLRLNLLRVVRERPLALGCLRGGGAPETEEAAQETSGFKSMCGTNGGVRSTAMQDVHCQPENIFCNSYPMTWGFRCLLCFPFLTCPQL